MDVLGYCVRIDAIDGYLDKIRMLELVDEYKSIIGVKHMGKEKTNPHYHLVIKTNVKQQALRVRFKKIFDQGKGNGHLSIKVWDGDEKAVSYLFHEDINSPLIIRKNVSDEYLSKAKQLCSEIKGKVEDAKERAAYKLEDIVFDYFKGSRPDEREVAQRILLTAWRSDKYAPNDWLLKAMTGKIMFRLQEGDDESEEQLAAAYVSKIFRY